MATGKKIKTEEHIQKIKQSNRENREKKIQEKEQLVNQIREESKKELLPTLKEKTTELTNYIIELLKNKGEEKVNNIQIMSLIAQRSMLEVANVGNITYTPQEIMLGFNLYLEMINKINEIKKLFKETPFPLDGAGFCENREFLIISGQVCRDSKKEAQAEYTIFKEKLLRIFKRFYKKVRLIDIFITYFTTLH